MGQIRYDQVMAATDAFSRLRVSNPVTLFSSKMIADEQDPHWDDQETSGAGTGSSFTAPVITLSVGNTTAGVRVRQTRRRFNYQAGKSQAAFITGVMGETSAGISKFIGAFDQNDGFFFYSQAGTLGVGIRSNITGSPVDIQIAQADWNIDTLDGNGPTGITLDMTKTQIFIIDYQWLGVGRVRYGFDLDGDIVYCHQQVHANILTVPYSANPSVPVRYEIQNDGAGPASTLGVICSMVMSEGGQENIGSNHWYSTLSGTANANVIGTYYALVGIRLKSTHFHATIIPQTASVVAKTVNHVFEWRLLIGATVAGTFAYASGGADHSIEIAIGNVAANPSPNTVSGGEALAGGYGSTNTSVAQGLATDHYIGSLIDGTPEELVLAVTPLQVNSDIAGGLSFREIM